jgi:hypothetical protein
MVVQHSITAYGQQQRPDQPAILNGAQAAVTQDADMADFYI